VTTDTCAQPTEKNFRNVVPGDRKGRGSMVFFNQATMRTLAVTGHDSLNVAQANGQSRTSDWGESAQKAFTRTEFVHYYSY
jgi:hypothetical protein